MGKDELLAFIRHALTIFGTWLAYHGYATADDSTALVSDAMQAIGGALPIIAFIWSLKNKADHRAALAAAGPAVPGQKNIGGTLAVLFPIAITFRLSGCGGSHPPV